LHGKDLRGRVDWLKPEGSGSLGKIDFREANFRRTDLSGFNLSEVDLRGTDLRYANLCGTNFSHAQLQDADLRGASYDAQTRWPVGFDPERAGARWVE